MISTIRAKFRPARAVVGECPAPRRAWGDRLARQLALAHRIERAIQASELASYGAAARTLGLTQPRVSQIMALLLLPPAIQERILLEGSLGIRAAMRVAREVEWEHQPGKR